MDIGSEEREKDKGRQKYDRMYRRKGRTKELEIKTVARSD